MLALLLALAVTAGPVIDGIDVGDWSLKQLWERSDKYFHDGDFPKSIHLLDRIILLDPSDIEAHSVAAWLTWSLGDEPRARQYLQDAVKRNPDNWESHYELGFHYFDRLGEAAAGATSFQRAVTLGGGPAYVQRMLAHALCYDERPNEAVALWRKVAADGRTPAVVATNNRLRALRWALRSDLVARHGGVTEGPLGPERPVVLSDLRTDENGDGSKEHRVLLLHDPARAGQSADVRIVYQGQRIGNRIDWHWLTMSVDTLGEGNFDHSLTLADTDGDGIAESLGSVEELKAQRALPLSPLLKRFAAPDRYELEVDARGWAAPATARQDGERVLFTPKFLVACEAGPLALRVTARDPASGNDTALATVPVPSGVYAGNDGAGPAYQLAAALPAAGRAVLALELLRDGVVVDRKTNPAWTVVGDGHSTRLTEPTAAERTLWREPTAEAHDAPAPGARRDLPERRTPTKL